MFLTYAYFEWSYVIRISLAFLAEYKCEKLFQTYLSGDVTNIYRHIERPHWQRQVLKIICEKWLQSNLYITLCINEQWCYVSLMYECCKFFHSSFGFVSIDRILSSNFVVHEMLLFSRWYLTNITELLTQSRFRCEIVSLFFCSSNLSMTLNFVL